MFQFIDYKDSIYSKSNPIFQTDIWNKTIPWFEKVEELDYLLEPFPPEFKINMSQITPNIEIPNLITGIQNMENRSHLGLLGNQPNFTVDTKKINPSQNPHYITALQTAPLLPEQTTYNNVKRLLYYLDLKDAGTVSTKNRVYFDTRDQKEAYYINMKKDLPLLYKSENILKDEIFKIERFLDENQSRIIAFKQRKLELQSDIINNPTITGRNLPPAIRDEYFQTKNNLKQNSEDLNKNLTVMTEKFHHKLIAQINSDKYDDISRDIERLRESVNSNTAEFNKNRDIIKSFYNDYHAPLLEKSEQEIHKINQTIIEIEQEIYEFRNILTTKQTRLKELQIDIKQVENSNVKNLTTLGGINSIKPHEKIEESSHTLVATDANLLSINKAYVQLPFNIFDLTYDSYLTYSFNSSWGGLNCLISIPNYTNLLKFPDRYSCVTLLMNFIGQIRNAGEKKYPGLLLQYVSYTSFLNEILLFNTPLTHITNPLLSTLFLSLLTKPLLVMEQLSIEILNESDYLKEIGINSEVSLNLEKLKTLLKPTTKMIVFFKVYKLCYFINDAKADYMNDLETIIPQNIDVYINEEQKYYEGLSALFNDVKNYIISFNNMIIFLTSKKIGYPQPYFDEIYQSFEGFITTYLNIINGNNLITQINLIYLKKYKDAKNPTPKPDQFVINLTPLGLTNSSYDLQKFISKYIKSYDVIVYDTVTKSVKKQNIVDIGDIHTDLDPSTKLHINALLDYILNKSSKDVFTFILENWSYIGSTKNSKVIRNIQSMEIEPINQDGIPLIEPPTTESDLYIADNLLFPMKTGEPIPKSSIISLYSVKPDTDTPVGSSTNVTSSTEIIDEDLTNLEKRILPTPTSTSSALKKVQTTSSTPTTTTQKTTKLNYFGKIINAIITIEKPRDNYYYIDEFTPLLFYDLTNTFYIYKPKGVPINEVGIKTNPIYLTDKPPTEYITSTVKKTISSMKYNIYIAVSGTTYYMFREHDVVNINPEIIPDINKSIVINYFGTSITPISSSIPPTSNYYYTNTTKPMLYKEGDKYYLYPGSVGVANIGTSSYPIVITEKPPDKYVQNPSAIGKTTTISVYKNVYFEYTEIQTESLWLDSIFPLNITASTEAFSVRLFNFGTYLRPVLTPAKTQVSYPGADKPFIYTDNLGSYFLYIPKNNTIPIGSSPEHPIYLGWDVGKYLSNRTGSVYTGQYDGLYFAYIVPPKTTSTSTTTTTTTTATTTPSSTSTTNLSAPSSNFTLNYFGTTLKVLTTSTIPSKITYYYKSSEPLLYSTSSQPYLYIPAGKTTATIGKIDSPIIIEKAPTNSNIISSFSETYTDYSNMNYVYYYNGFYYLYRVKTLKTTTPSTSTPKTTTSTSTTTPTTTTTSTTTTTTTTSNNYSLNYFGTTINYNTTSKPQTTNASYISDKEPLLYSKNNIWTLYLPVDMNIKYIGTSTNPIIIEKAPSSVYFRGSFSQTYNGTTYTASSYYYSNYYYVHRVKLVTTTTPATTSTPKTTYTSTTSNTSTTLATISTTTPTIIPTPVTTIPVSKTLSLNYFGTTVSVNLTTQKYSTTVFGYATTQPILYMMNGLHYLYLPSSLTQYTVGKSMSTSIYITSKAPEKYFKEKTIQSTETAYYYLCGGLYYIYKEKTIIKTFPTQIDYFGRIIEPTLTLTAPTKNEFYTSSKTPLLYLESYKYYIYIPSTIPSTLYSNIGTSVSNSLDIPHKPATTFIIKTEAASGGTKYTAVYKNRYFSFTEKTIPTKTTTTKSTSNSYVEPTTSTNEGSSWTDAFWIPDDPNPLNWKMW